MTRFFLILLILGLSPGTGSATPWQSLDEIRQVAEAYARESAVDSLRTVQSGTLDSRLHLKKCTGSLQAFSPPGTRPGPNMTVGVRCTGVSPWKIFVPVRSKMTGLVLVSRHALQRGHQLRPEDVVLAEHDLDLLPYGYSTDTDDLAGRILRRPIPPGAVIIPPMLGQARTVRRGQTVTLFVGQTGVNIQMAGQALADAALHQRIRVKNLSSGRIVEGVVRSAERVEILMK